MIRKPHNKTTKPSEDKAEDKAAKVSAEERQGARKSEAGTANTTKAKTVEEGKAASKRKATTPAATKPKKRKPVKPQDAVPPPRWQIAAANAADEGEEAATANAAANAADEVDDDIPELPAPVDGVELLDDESASNEEVDDSDGEE